MNWTSALAKHIRDEKQRKLKMSKETVYGLSVCEDCNKSTEVVYKCWEQDGYSLEVENIVYRCYECAFEHGD